MGVAHPVEFLQGLRQARVGILRDLRVEHRVHGSQRGMLLHDDIGHREQAGGKHARRGAGPLDGIGIETNGPLLRHGVLGEEAFLHQPFAEELAHLRLQRAAFQGQLAGCRCPLEPFVRGDPRQHRSGAADGRPHVVPAQDHHLLHRIPVGEAGRPGHEGLGNGGFGRPGSETGTAGHEEKGRQKADSACDIFVKIQSHLIWAPRTFFRIGWITPSMAV